MMCACGTGSGIHHILATNGSNIIFDACVKNIICAIGEYVQVLTAWLSPSRTVTVLAVLISACRSGYVFYLCKPVFVLQPFGNFQL